MNYVASTLISKKKKMSEWVRETDRHTEIHAIVYQERWLNRL